MLNFFPKIKDVYLEYLNPSKKPYIFLDEIQNIQDWEKWVNKEYELKLSNIVNNRIKLINAKQRDSNKFKRKIFKC